jgi:serine protease AprX
MLRTLILLLSLTSVALGGNLQTMFPASAIDDNGEVKAWIYFDGRGLEPAEQHALLIELEANLDTHCLARRAKVMEAPYALELDLPLNEIYVREVLEQGATLRHQSRWLNAISVKATLPVLAEVEELEFVRVIKPVAVGRRSEPQQASVEQLIPFATDSRLDYGNSYAQLEQLGVIAAHEQGLSGAGVRVMMLDTGYYKDHEAIPNDQILAEWDFINNDGNTQNEGSDDSDQHNHGTMTLTALGGSFSGSHYGPAYGATFLLAKTEDVTSETPVEEDNYVAALEWGELQGADVASASLGYLDWYDWSDMDGQTAITTIGVNTAISLGMIITNAAGNENGSAWNHIIAPADAFEVITVGAVDSGGGIAYFSSHGPTYDGRIKPEVVARGVSTACAGTASPSHYTTANGTSLSTPLIGGCVALLLEAAPGATPQEIRDALMLTADNASSPDNTYGWGLVSVPLALASLVSFELVEVDLLSDDDGDGVLEPGESGELSLLIENVSDGAFGTVEGTLSTTSEWISIVTATASYPGFAPGEQHANLTPFVLSVDAEAPPVFSADLTLALTADGSEQLIVATMGVGQLTEYYTFDVEQGAGEWTHAAADGWSDQWHISTEDSQSPTHSWKCGDGGTGDYAAQLDSRLTTEPVQLLSYSTLAFTHRINAEISGSYPDSAYDGGIVEISTDGANWTQLAGDYNKNFRWESGSGNPATHPFPGGISCFSGSFDWQESVFDLAALAGETAQFRFRFGSDSGGGDEGWYIDDVSLTGYEQSQPGEPLVISINYSDPLITISWEAEPQATGYRVYRCDTPHGDYELVQEGSSPGYTTSEVGTYFYYVTWF